MDSPTQIFFDRTGKRKKRFNRLAVLGSLVALILAIFVAVIIFDLEKTKNTARDNKYQTSGQRSDISMLYTENHKNSYTMLNEKITILDNLLIPRYLLSINDYQIPEYYQNLLLNSNYIEGANAKPTDKYFLLSSLDYGLQPMERHSKDVKNSLIYLDNNKLKALVEDIEKNKGKGLLIELNPAEFKNEAEKTAYLNQLKKLKILFKDKNLALGIRVQTTALDEGLTEIYQQADWFNLSYFRNDTITAHTESIAKNVNSLGNKKTIIELPTVSQKVGTKFLDDYLHSLDYKEAERIIQNYKMSDRDKELFSFNLFNYHYIIRDAIESHNYLAKINSRFKNTDNLSYAISDPGFEEYTTWKIFTDCTDDSQCLELLSEGVEAGIGIEVSGDGQVYELISAGEKGKRKIETDRDGLVISSVTQKVSLLPTVTKSGRTNKKIALTFDDGPDPVYTRKIMDILDRYQVKGTFFIIGKNLLENPSIGKEIVSRGHQIENHTYSHPRVNLLDHESKINQIKSTSELIRKITGQKDQYFRQPYGENNELGASPDISHLEVLKELGLKASQYDIDSKDWQATSAQEIYEKVAWDIENSNGQYSQILFHDSGNNAAKTVEALPKVIEYLITGGIEIVPVNMLAASEVAVETSVTHTGNGLKILGIWMIIVVYLIVFFIAFSIIKNLWLIWGTLVYNLRKRKRRKEQTTLPESGQKISIIIASYNEMAVIGKTIESLLNNTYQNIEIIVANDGSTDQSADIVNKYVGLDSRVLLLDLPHRGKAETIDTAIRVSTSEWLVFCDADTVFDREAIAKFAQVINDNGNLGAIAGRILVGNSLNMLTRYQFIEYGIAHRFIKPAMDVLNTIIVVPGAIGLWNKAILQEAGGFSPVTLAEDADTTMEVISRGKNVRFRDGIVARTEVPITFTSLFKQRTRWQLGNMQALRKHSKGFFRRKYGYLGSVGMPMLAIDIFSAILFPLFVLFLLWLFVADLFSLYYLFDSSIDFYYSTGFKLLAQGLFAFEFLLCLIAIFFEKADLKTKLLAVITLPYYFIIYKAFLSFVTIVSLLRAARGTSHGWGFVKRTATVK